LPGSFTIVGTPPIGNTYRGSRFITNGIQHAISNHTRNWRGEWRESKR
jgi:hypothetical protein